MSVRALFLDFNSYFASVEQQLQPRLRHRPVAVVPALTDSTCCIAASYEAKAFGIKTGTNVGDARRMCRNLQIVQARPELYTDFHYRLLNVVETCVPIRDVKSVDEMVCDLTGSQRSRENSIRLAKHIKSTIYRDVGPYLRCSIGLAPNTFLAKTATELQKPDGLVVIEPQDLPECLFGLELRDLCGIGARMEKRLWQHGIVTVEQLYRASRARLRNVWGGIGGDRMYDELRGEEPFRPQTRRGSVGHSHVLPPEYRNAEGARSVLCRLLQKGAMRLRRLKVDYDPYTQRSIFRSYMASGVEICIKFAQYGYWWDKSTFAHTADTLTLTQKMCDLWDRRPEGAGAPLKVSITLLGLRPMKDCNLSLFENRDFLYENVDYLNDKFGRMKVYLGGAHLAHSTSAQPIAFNFVPELVEMPTKKPCKYEH